MATTLLTCKLQMMLDWMRVIIKEHEESFGENSLRDFVDAFIAEKRKGEDSTFSVRNFNFVTKLRTKTYSNN